MVTSKPISDTPKNVTLPFLSGLFQDICELFPENDFSYEKEVLSRLSAYPVDTLVLDFSLMGKSLERSLIALNTLSIPPSSGSLPSVFQDVQNGTVLPRFFYSIWSELFLDDGYLIFHPSVLDGCIEDLSDAYVQRKAICVLVLRQLLLGFSKLEDLECLWRSRRRSFFLYPQGHPTTHDLLREPGAQHDAILAWDVLLRRTLFRVKARRCV